MAFVIALIIYSVATAIIIYVTNRAADNLKNKIVNLDKKINSEIVVIGKNDIRFRKRNERLLREVRSLSGYSKETQAEVSNKFTEFYNGMVEIGKMLRGIESVVRQNTNEDINISRAIKNIDKKLKTSSEILDKVNKAMDTQKRGGKRC